MTLATRAEEAKVGELRFRIEAEVAVAMIRMLEDEGWGVLVRVTKASIRGK